MKCYWVVIFLSIGLQNLHAEDEVVDPSDDITEPSIISDMEETTADLSRDYNEELSGLEARLPSDYHSIRMNVIDTNFSCNDREPGFYADVENECQIFHRCLEGQPEKVFSFICPSETVFSQKALVCVWNDTINCDDSEDYYDESNRAFAGNYTAESSIDDNIKNSMEITQIDEVQTDGVKDDVMMESVKLFELPESVVDGNAEINEKNTFEEKQNLHVESETEESNEFQAELIPSTFNGIDASVATTSESDSASHPQKISVSVLEPIIEMPQQDQDEIQITDSTRNIRKQYGNHRNRFLFKADAH